MTAAAGHAVVYGLAAAAVWGAADFCGGLVTRRIKPAFVVFFAHGFGLLLLLIAAFALHGAPPNASTIAYGLLSGVAGGLALIAFYQALALGSMGLTAAVAGVLTAAVPVVFSFFTEGHPAPLKLTGFAVAGVAIWLISYIPGNKAHPRGLGLAVVAGLGFGILLVLLRTASQQSLIWGLVFSRVASASVAGVASLLVLLPRSSESNPRFRWRAVLPLALLAGLLDTSGNLLYALASLAGRLDVAAVLSSLYPAATILLAAWLLKERTTGRQAIGMALAIAAVAMISA